MTSGPHQCAEDPRNKNVLIHLNGKLVPREQALVSVFDSGFLMGDGVWEGLRVHHGQVPYLNAHLRRLFQGARAIDLDIGKSAEELAESVNATIHANQMVDGVHIRLMVTRGLKRTPFQGPSVNVGIPTIVIAAEYKEPDPMVKKNGIRLFTVHVRRGRPDVQDPRWNSHSKLNCVTACIQAEKAGADEGLMLDPHGFVSTCNSTHFFIVVDGELWTSTGKYCLHGITRANICRIAREHNLTVLEKDFSLTDVYSADEAFVTGTFSGITPVKSADGRNFLGNIPGPITSKLRDWYAQDIARECDVEINHQ